jgi:hypothetical protein
VKPIGILVETPYLLKISSISLPTMLRESISSFVFACLFSLFLHAQPCALPYLSSATSFTEVCSASGSATYSITIAAASDSTLAITGLYNEPTGTLIADIDCNGNSFSFAYQAQAPSYFLTGQGMISGQTVSIGYSVYQSSDSSFMEACNGAYGPGSVGLESQPSSFDLFLYPNPAFTKATLAISGSTITDWTCDLLDFQGRIIYCSSVNSGNSMVLDLKELPQGMYLVKVSNTLGESKRRILVVR